jgi:3-isopropylmalate/(R)-2-methylmalate dehydratase small subunit
MIVHEGRARCFGDNVNADYIISSTRKRETLDERVLARYLFETLDPAFAASVRPNDIIVAGRNFGCGSAMEVAATVLLGAGIRCVLAESFARSFFRNAINNGLVPIECETGWILEGDAVSARIEGGRGHVTCPPGGRTILGAALPPVMVAILEQGGLVPYLRHHGRFEADQRAGAARAQGE